MMGTKLLRSVGFTHDRVWCGICMHTPYMEWMASAVLDHTHTHTHTHSDRALGAAGLSAASLIRRVW